MLTSPFGRKNSIPVLANFPLDEWQESATKEIQLQFDVSCKSLAWFTNSQFLPIETNILSHEGMELLNVFGLMEKEAQG